MPAARVRLVLSAFLFVAGVSALAEITPHGGMIRSPDVSATHIVFLYANDLWVAPRDGGVARPLARPEGVEAFPRFSPDGQTVAFMGNYAGDTDLYTVPVEGGVPFRVTHHPTTEYLCDWTPDGSLLFHARGLGNARYYELHRVDAGGGLPEKLPVPYGGNGAISSDGTWLAYTPSVRDSRTWKRYRGGMAADVWLFNLRDYSSRRITDWEGTDSIPMWHGDKIYYLSDAGPNHRLNIWEFDTKTGNTRQVTQFTDFDVKWPAIGPGPDGRGEIVFQYGPELRLLDLQTDLSRPVEITLPGDRPTLRARRVDASDDMQRTAISATGKRAVLEARGDIWTVPAKDGIPRNLTRTDGVAERDPAWSPDGRWIAYFSDEPGEYELYVTQSDGKGETRKLTDLGPGWRWMRGWSPDSKYVAFCSNTAELYLCEVETGELTLVDTDPGGDPPGANWSHDSRWITYARSLPNQLQAIYVYNVETGEKHQVTHGMFHDQSPTFDRKGDWLFFASERHVQSPIYDDLRPSFVYTGTDVLIAVPLRTDVEYPWLPENDEEKWDDDEQDGDEDEEQDAENGKTKEKKESDDEGEEDDQPVDDGVSGTWEGMIRGDEPLPPSGLPVTLTLLVQDDGTVTGSLSGGPYVGTVTGGDYDKAARALSFTLEVQTEEGLQSFACTATISDGTMNGTVTGPDFSATFEVTRTSSERPEEADGDKEKKKDKAREKVEIALDGFETRAIQLPVSAGYLWGLSVNDKNQLIYVRRGMRGSGDPTALKLFDLDDDKKEEKTVLSGAGSYDISADGKKLLIRQGSRLSIVDARPGQKTSDRVPADDLFTMVAPRNEWQQLFTDAWRIQRDFFYVSNMHGVDWPAVREHYAAMLDDCVSRDDLAYVIREMISELNVGHAYYRSGPHERGPRENVGVLGVDFSLENGAFRIKAIHEGGPWDIDARNPLTRPGVDVKVGDYLLAVNGVPLDASKDPWAAFVGQAGETVLLTVSEKPVMDDDAREVLVEMLRSESGLRYRAWVEANRKYVEDRSGGKVGYIHVPNTGRQGQNELFRQYFGQIDKAALIIDERWNGGGQIPDRFIELLNRPLLNWWARRAGWDGPTPRNAHFGPKCMLINGWAGSGGDMFPALFRQVGLGELIGRRTWGGLVGISGNPRLIDGTSISVPTFGYYEKDGTWGIEGHGVDPDIEVIDDPAKMVDGSDPQLDAAIEHMLEAIEKNPPPEPVRPAPPDRSGMGIRDEDI